MSYFLLLLKRFKWATARQNRQTYMCAQPTLRSAWASAQSDQSSLCPQWVAKGPRFPYGDGADWPEWAYAHANLSLHWTHWLFCWFCRIAAQISFKTPLSKKKNRIKNVSKACLVPQAKPCSSHRPYLDWLITTDKVSLITLNCQWK